jgi:outer membrane protein assembly factor BamB
MFAYGFSRGESMTRTCKVILVILLSLVLVQFSSALAPSNASASNADWPAFRNDLSHTGYTNASGPTSSAPTVLWAVKTGAAVWSSPAFVNGGVYVGCRDGNVYCINSATGDIAWNSQTGSLIEYSSPAVVGNRVYICLNDGHVCSLDAFTGDIIWKIPLPSLVRTSPTVVDGRVYVGCWDHNVYCLNASNGAQIWRYTTLNQIDSSPAVVDSVVYVGSDDNYVYALNASNGTKIWAFQTGGTVGSSPSVVNGYVYVGAGNGDVYGLNASTGARIWKYHTEDSVVSSPAVADGRVYVGSEDCNIYCFNALTGDKIWQSPTGYWVWSSPAVANGYVYVGSEDYNIYCLDASTGAKLWSYPTRDQVDSSPTIANGCLYIGSADFHVYALGNSPSGASPPPAENSALGVIVFDVLVVFILGVALVACAFFVRSSTRSNRNAQTRADSGRLRLWFSAHLDAICVLAILAFSTVFFLNLNGTALWIADEQTYSQWAFHMVKTGDYLTPWAFGGSALWIGKPPLTMWLMSLSYQVFGATNFATRVWSAVFGTLSCILVFYLGKELYNRKVGLLSAAVLGTFVTFSSFATHGMTDIPLLFFILASIFYLLLSQKPKNTNRYAALSGLFLGLALLTKQVEALLIPLIILCYFALSQRSVRFLFTKRFALFLGVACLVFVPWLLYMNANWGSGFWDQYFLYSGVSRSFEALEGHAGGYLYYFTYLATTENILWVALLPFAAVLCLYNAFVKRVKADLLLLVWMSVVLLVFSVAQTKLPWYLLPALPAFAIAVSSFLYSFTKSTLNIFHKQTKPKRARDSTHTA